MYTLQGSYLTGDVTKWQISASGEKMYHDAYTLQKVETDHLCSFNFAAGMVPFLLNLIQDVSPIGSLYEYNWRWRVKRKCKPILLYGLECYTLLKADIRSLDFVVTRFLIKLFKSTNTDTINDCIIYFNFLMPSELVEIRKNRYEGKFIDCCNLLYYFGINKIM